MVQRLVCPRVWKCVRSMSTPIHPPDHPTVKLTDERQPSITIPTSTPSPYSPPLTSNLFSEDPFPHNGRVHTLWRHARMQTHASSQTTSQTDGQVDRPSHKHQSKQHTPSHIPVWRVIRVAEAGVVQTKKPVHSSDKGECIYLGNIFAFAGVSVSLSL